MRSEILKLRNDPAANALMAGAFTKSNASALSERLGREPSEGELYIAHFLGVGGGARLIELAASNPNGKAADAFPGAAQANPSIFYDRTTGAARSLAQVRDVLTARYDVARGAQGDAGAADTGAVEAPAAAITAADPKANAAASHAAAPDTAGIASAFAAAIPARKADDTQVFHALFADDHRTIPLASMVGALWDGSNAATPNGNANSMLNLFRDLPTGS